MKSSKTGKTTSLVSWVLNLPVWLALNFSFVPSCLPRKKPATHRLIREDHHIPAMRDDEIDGRRLDGTGNRAFEKRSFSLADRHNPDVLRFEHV